MGKWGIRNNGIIAKNWQSNSIGLIENPRVAEESFRMYLAQMKANTDKAGFPMPDESLAALHRGSEDEALKAFHAKKIGDAVDNHLKTLKVGSFLLYLLFLSLTSIKSLKFSMPGNRVICWLVWRTYHLFSLLLHVIDWRVKQDKIYEEYVKYQSTNRERAVHTCKTIFESLAHKVDEKVNQAQYKDVFFLTHSFLFIILTLFFSYFILCSQVTDLLHDLDTLHTAYINASKEKNVALISAQAEFFKLAPDFWVPPILHFHFSPSLLSPPFPSFPLPSFLSLLTKQSCRDLLLHAQQNTYCEIWTRNIPNFNSNSRML
jgi:hypothetical protein